MFKALCVGAAAQTQTQVIRTIPSNTVWSSSPWSSAPIIFRDAQTVADEFLQNEVCPNLVVHGFTAAAQLLGCPVSALVVVDTDQLWLQVYAQALATFNRNQLAIQAIVEAKLEQGWVESQVL